MRSNRRRDTRPELAVRSSLWRRGLRYRVDHPPLRGLNRRADLVFVGPRVAVFIDGCFWHSCPDHATRPTRNGAFWAAKLDRNRERDADTNIRLTEAGWLVLRFWEHEPPEEVADQVAEAVRIRLKGTP